MEFFLPFLTLLFRFSYLQRPFCPKTYLIKLLGFLFLLIGKCTEGNLGALHRAVFSSYFERNFCLMETTLPSPSTSSYSSIPRTVRAGRVFPKRVKNLIIFSLAKRHFLVWDVSAAIWYERKKILTRVCVCAVATLLYRRDETTFS